MDSTQRASAGSAIMTGGVVEELHGTLVADPYRLLEDPADSRTQAWQVAQNARTRAALDALPGRDALRTRLRELLQTGLLSAPEVRAGRAFYLTRTGGDVQIKLVLRENGVERVLVDPAAAAPDGLLALDWWYPSPQGTYVAYGLSRDGDECSTLYVLNVARGVNLPEAIPDTRYTSLAWLPDESGFYYTRLPSGEVYRPLVRRHTLGQPWQGDPLVFGAERAREETPALALTQDGRWLVVTVYRGWSASDVYVADQSLAEPVFVTAVEGRSAMYDVSTRGDELIVRTNEGAPRYALYRVPAASPQRANWKLLVAESSDVLQYVAVSRSALVLSYTHDVAARLVRCAADGTLHDVALPELGTVAELAACETSDDVYVHYESYLQPATIYRVNASDGGVQRWDGLHSPIDASAYDVRREWFSSKDGTQIPLFVIARASTPRDGSAPAVLTGYGGFAIGRTPEFVAGLFPWLDAGGVYAVANLRGGGEFGQAWHGAGRRANKQNVFDDFIAAAEFLATSRIADPARLGLMGGSNGGLLVAAVATQRPELARAILCAVPLTDMLRYPKFSIGRLWLAEYGDPDDARDFATLHAYSPYHNVRAGVAYPEMLILSAESDSRVDAAHARKFGALLQAASSGGQVYVQIEANAGHGAGKPLTKLLDEMVDRWAYFGALLGVSYDEPPRSV